MGWPRRMFKLVRYAALALLISMIAACRTTPLEDARERVSVGTPREDAIAILCEGAWYHQECTTLGRVDDLFFYGSHKYDKAEIVIVANESVDGELVVRSIDGFESYAWHTIYQNCLQRDRFEE